MKTVWVVEEGSYSDYRVVGVFSSKENAEKVADLVGGCVDVWPLDPRIEDMNEGRYPYFVSMERDGTTRMVKREQWHYAFDRYHGRLDVEYPLMHPKGTLVGVVFATDEEHAVKIANETRARYIVEGKWPEE